MKKKEQSVCQDHVAYKKRHTDKHGYNVGDWICDDCAKTLGATKRIEISCYHMDTCDYCDETKAVTEPRDWGYPELDWKKIRKKNEN